MKHTTISDVAPRTSRRSITSATAPLILDAVRSKARAHRVGVRARIDRLPPAPARVLQSMPHRFADDRQFVGLKMALLGTALVLVAFLG